MAIVDSKNKTVKELEGLHLYHGNISNCSMRVRMTLEEKKLKWVSHHIDLKKKEKGTPTGKGKKLRSTQPFHQIFLLNQY